MSIQGNDNNKYSNFITSANNLYTQVKQEAKESYESVKNSRLASEFTKIIPTRNSDKPLSASLGQAWPVRAVNHGITVAAALYKSLSSKTAMTTTAKQTILQQTKVQPNETHESPIEVNQRKIYQQAATLDAQEILDQLTAGTLCSELVEKHGILQLKEKLPELHSLLTAAKNTGVDSKEIEKIQAQLKNIEEIAVNAQAMLDDNYSLDHINNVATFRFHICEGSSPLSELFPKQLTLKDPKTGLMEDDAGKAFGGIKDKNGLTDQFFELCDKHGGSSEIIKAWLTEQAGNTAWGGTANIIKYELFQLRGEVGEENYWSGTVNNDGTINENPIRSQPDKGILGLDHALKTANALASDDSPLAGDLDDVKKLIHTTLAAWTAYNLEFYRHTAMEGVDKENQTQTIYRTESPKGIEANGIPIHQKDDGTYEVDLNNSYTMKRGIYESGSRGAPVFAAGTAGRIITVQKVPLHRCIYTDLLYDLKPGESEVGVIGDGQNFHFQADQRAG